MARLWVKLGKLTCCTLTHFSKTTITCHGILHNCVNQKANVWARGMCSASAAEIRAMLQGIGGGTVHLEKDNDTGIAVITLDNQDRKNALSGKMMVELADVVSDLDQWKEGKGVILQGAGTSFCSGADLVTMRALLNKESGPKLCWWMQDTLTRLLQLPLVSVAIVRGAALGGGAELSTACDFRLVTERVSIGFVQMKMGLTTGWGGGTRLVRMLGYTTALDLLTSGQIMSWKEAVDLGLVNGVLIEDNRLLESAKEWLKKRTNADAYMVHGMKRMVTELSKYNLWESLDEERRVFASIWCEPAQMKALQGKIKHVRE